MSVDARAERRIRSRSRLLPNARFLPRDANVEDLFGYSPRHFNERLGEYAAWERRPVCVVQVRRKRQVLKVEIV